MTPREREIRERLKAATPGPWEAFDAGPWGGQGAGVAIGNDTKHWVLFGKTTEEPHISNSFLCAHAPDDISYLLAQLTTAREIIEVAKGALENSRAVVDEYECRGDEDCDHCQVVYHVIDPALAKITEMEKEK